MYKHVLVLAMVTLLLCGCDRQNPAEAFRNTVISGVEFGRDFALTDHNGLPRRLADYKGKVVVIFFGYTQCPDVCPTTLSGMAEVMKLLGESSRNVQVLFVTLDPERDTPKLLAAYVPQFNPSFIGLYGDLATTEATALEFKIFFKKQPGSTPKTYSVDHSANSYIYDPQGQLRLYVKHAEAPENIAADIKRLLTEK